MGSVAFFIVVLVFDLFMLRQINGCLESLASTCVVVPAEVHLPIVASESVAMDSSFPISQMFFLGPTGWLLGELVRSAQADPSFHFQNT